MKAVFSVDSTRTGSGSLFHPAIPATTATTPAFGSRKSVESTTQSFFDFVAAQQLACQQQQQLQQHHACSDYSDYNRRPVKRTISRRGAIGFDTTETPTSEGTTAPHYRQPPAISLSAARKRCRLSRQDSKKSMEDATARLASFSLGVERAKSWGYSSYPSSSELTEPSDEFQPAVQRRRTDELSRSWHDNTAAASAAPSPPQQQHQPPLLWTFSNALSKVSSAATTTTASNIWR
jgi:hypothetical protein